MPRVHDDELAIDESLVRCLLAEQFPEWADLPLTRVEPDGTVNVIYRLGADLSVRLPRRDGPETEADIEFEWLPFLAPRLPVEIPIPVARGRPGPGYPWYWSIHTWLDGDAPTAPLDAGDTAALVAALQRIDVAGGPEPAGGRGRPLETRDRVVRGRSSAWMHRARSSCGSGQCARRNGPARPCGSTPTSTDATSSSGTAASPPCSTGAASGSAIQPST